MAINALQPWMSRRRWLGAVVLSGLLAACAPIPGGMPSDGPLPSWNEGANKQRIVAFVKAVTAEGSKDYVVPAGLASGGDRDRRVTTSVSGAG